MQKTISFICLDAQDCLHDIGYLLPLSPRQRRFRPTPPNYGRFINSIRPDQVTDMAYNSVIQPDPVEGFSWFVSGPTPIPAGAEILVPYGDDFWDTPPSPVTTGKAFSSDNIGDGPPWYTRADSWIHYLGEGVDYIVGQDHIIVRRANAGVRVLHADIARVFDGATGVADLPLVPLTYHVHGQHASWVSLLHGLHQEAGHTGSLTTFVYRFLIPALATLQQQPEDHYLLHVLNSTPISELTDMAMNESTLPQLFDCLHLQVQIWVPLTAGWCGTTGHLPFTAPMHVQLAHGQATCIYPSGEQYRDLSVKVRTAIHHAITRPLGPSPCGCLLHRPELGPPRRAVKDWWYRRLSSNLFLISMLSFKTGASSCTTRMLQSFSSSQP